MISRLVRKLKRWASGGERALVNQPLLAGYRREARPGTTALLTAILALAAFLYGLAFSYYAPARMTPLVAPLAVLGAIVIWVLPAGDYAPTRLIEPIFVAFMAALILWPNYLAVGLPGLPWLTMIRIIGVPMLVVTLVCLSASSVFRSRLWGVVSNDKPLFWLFAIFVLMQTITLPLSSDTGASLNRWIISQTNWTTIFILSCVVFIRPGFAEYWARILLFLLFSVCVFALWEGRIGHVPWGGHIPPFLRIDDPAVQRILSGASRATTGIYRVQGTSSTPLGLAEILGLSLPFAVHFIVDRRPILLRAAAILYVPTAIYVILLTDSRLGLVAALSSVLLYVLVWALLRWRSQPGSIVGPAIVLSYPVFFIGSIASSFMISRLRNEIWGNNAQASSTEARFEQWAMGFPKFLKNPIGHGPGQAAEILGFANGAGVITIDTYYLSILLEFGIVGFFAYFLLFLRAAWIGSNLVVKERLEGELRLLIPSRSL